MTTNKIQRRTFHAVVSICKMEFIRIQSPLSEPDEESILFLLETLDGKKRED